MPLIALLTFFLAPFVHAANSASAAAPQMIDPVAPGALLQLLLGLLAVIALILLLAWFARRVNLVPGQRSGMQVVAVLPLGQRERAVLVQVGERQLLLGVGNGQVSLLQQFDEPVLEPSRAGTGAFAQRLQEALRRQREPLQQKAPDSAGRVQERTE